MKAEEFVYWAFGVLIVVVTIVMSAVAIDMYRDILSLRKNKS